MVTFGTFHLDVQVVLLCSISIETFVTNRRFDGKLLVNLTTASLVLCFLTGKFRDLFCYRSVLVRFPF